jgi:putative ABC transport system substrate-binding protein
MIPSSGCPLCQPDRSGQARRRARSLPRSYTTPRDTILAGKNLELATQLLPGAARIGVLVNVANAESVDQRRDMNDAVRKLPVTIVPAEVRKPDELGPAFDALVKSGAEAVVVLQDSMFFSEHRRILSLAAKARLAAIWSTRLFAEAGGLISYGVDESDSFRRAAAFVDKIFKGAKPSELPLELPTKFELVVNIKTARALDIEVPASCWLWPTR